MPNRANLRLKFLTVEERPVWDPAVRVEIRALRDHKRLAVRRLTLPSTHVFKVPAIPDPYQNFKVFAAPTLFKSGNLGTLALMDRGSKIEEREFLLLRRPQRWEARFDKWADLGRSFAGFRRVLKASQTV